MVSFRGIPIPENLADTLEEIAVKCGRIFSVVVAFGQSQDDSRSSSRILHDFRESNVSVMDERSRLVFVK